MKQTKIHIEEESIRFFRALFAVACIGGATYLLVNAFIARSWSFLGYRQLLSLLLLALGGYQIIKASAPLYRFDLTIDDCTLIIKIKRGEKQSVGVRRINLNDIEALRISPHTSRSASEALFDFSTDYHLLYKNRLSGRFERLIYLDGHAFTLKVKDIRTIMRFLMAHNQEIKMPDEKSLFMELNHRSASRTTRG